MALCQKGKRILERMVRMVLVSGCLLGHNCKYNGGNNLTPSLVEQLRTVSHQVICPECMGGLCIPHLPSEIEVGFSGEDVLCGRGKVFAQDGSDVTQAFLNGAYAVLDIAKKTNPSCIYLKQSSPSCGCGLIYDGTFTHQKKPGNGVTTALLLKHHFPVTAV